MFRSACERAVTCSYLPMHTLVCILICLSTPRLMRNVPTLTLMPGRYVFTCAQCTCVADLALPVFSVHVLKIYLYLCTTIRCGCLKPRGPGGTVLLHDSIKGWARSRHSVNPPDAPPLLRPNILFFPPTLRWPSYASRAAGTLPRPERLPIWVGAAAAGGTFQQNVPPRVHL